MGFRLQRRIRFAPDPRFTPDERVVTLSLGGSGGELGWRERLDARAARLGHHATSAAILDALLADGEALPMRLGIDASGDVSYRYADDTPLSTDEVRVLHRHAEEPLREALAARCARLNADNAWLARLHEATPPPDLAPHTARPYPEPPPPPLTLEDPATWHSLWPPARRRREEENARREAEHAQAYRRWELDKAAFDAREFAREQREQKGVHQDPEAMQACLSEHLATLGWPCETAIDLELAADFRTIALDIALPGEGELPDRDWRMPARRLKLTPVRLSATRQRERYRDHVHAVAFRVLGEVFARLPRVETVRLSGYRPSSDRAPGTPLDRYLFSVEVGRGDWQAIDFAALETIDPVAVMEGFALRRDMTRTGIFRDIVPFEPVT